MIEQTPKNEFNQPLNNQGNMNINRNQYQQNQVINPNQQSNVNFQNYNYQNQVAPNHSNHQGGGVMMPLGQESGNNTSYVGYQQVADTSNHSMNYNYNNHYNQPITQNTHNQFAGSYVSNNMSNSNAINYNQVNTEESMNSNSNFPRENEVNTYSNNQYIPGEIRMSNVHLGDKTQFRTTPVLTPCPNCKEIGFTDVKKKLSINNLVCCLVCSTIPWIVFQSARGKEINCNNAEHVCYNCKTKIHDYTAC